MCNALFTFILSSSSLFIEAARAEDNFFAESSDDTYTAQLSTSFLSLSHPLEIECHNFYKLEAFLKTKRESS